MTCIVGLIDGGDVYLGGDSAVSYNGNEVTIMKQPKVFRNGEFLLGSTGSVRILQLLCYSFTPPERPFARDLDRYMATDFLEALRRCFKDAGLAHREYDEESYYGRILVGYRGRLFHIGPAYGLHESQHGYDAIGSGGEFAKGALYATRSLPPSERITLALESAALHAEGVRPPFIIEMLSGSGKATPKPATEPLAVPEMTLEELKDVPT